MPLSNAPPSPSALPSARWLRRLAVALPMAGLLVVAAAVWRLQSAHDALVATILDDASDRAQQLAAAKALQIEGLLTGADLALRQVRDQAQAAPADRVALHTVAQRVLDALPPGMFTHISMADAQGRITYPSASMRGADGAPLTVADRPYFTAHQAATDDRLLVDPLVRSRITGLWTLPLTRALRADGRFAGVTHLALAPSFLGDALAREQAEGQDVLSLLHADGSYVARSAGGEKLLGTRSPADWPFLQPGAPAKGQMRQVSPVDGRARLYAWYRLDRLPLIVNVGFDEDRVLAPALEEERRAHLRVAALAPLGLAALLAISWLLLRVAREQAALAASRGLLNATLDATTEGVLVVGADGRVLHVNRRLRQIWQLPDHMGEGSPHAAVLAHGAAQSAEPQAFEALHRQIDSGSDMALATLPCSDGRALEFQSRAVALDGGGVRLWTVRDVTALRLNQQELEQRVQERTQALKRTTQQLLDTQFAMDSVGIGIEWVDTETLRFVDVNRMVAQMFGYTVQEMLQMHVHDLDMHTTAAEFHQRVQALRQLGQTRREVVARRRDGTALPLEVTAFYLAGRDGTPDRVISFLTDISERKAAEAAMLRAKEAAEAANVAKSAFLANMSHEIRTPLNAITGMAYLIARDGLPPKQAQRLAHIKTAANHLVEMLDAVLDLSRIEADRLTLDEQPLDVRQVVQNVATMLQDKLQAKQLALDVRLDLPPGPWLGDATRLQQALLNYAANAVKFTERGGIVLRAGLADADAPGGPVADAAPGLQLLRFEVQDTGPGIDAATAARLFTPFEQADNSTTRQHGGSGLGLAITAKLARLMGGEAGLDSTPGMGSRFWFTARLRLAAAPPKAPAGQTPPTAAESAATLLRRQCAGRRVLLVEDDASNREVALDLLQACDLRVDTASDGLDAVAAAQAGAPDLVLMDLQLPLMDGLAAARRLHALPGLDRLPILAFTANAFADEHARCLAAGLVGVVTKPVNPEDLYQAILPWLVAATGSGPRAGDDPGPGAASPQAVSRPA